MNNLIEGAKAEIIKMEKIIRKTEDFLKSAPDGCLKGQRKREKTFFISMNDH